MIMGMGIALVLILIAAAGASWLITCGLVKLIGLCFGFAFGWKIGTGVWLVGVLTRCLIKNFVKITIKS